MTAVLDASAVLAIVFDEPGADEAIRYARGSLVSAVNMAEVVEKAEAHQISANDLVAQLRRLEIDIAAFDQCQAVVLAGLRPAARRIGVSLADCACLALAASSARIAVTADRDWQRLDHAVEIVLIR